MRAKLVRDADEADRESQRPAHRPKTVDNNESDINSSRPTGTSRAAACRPGYPTKTIDAVARARALARATRHKSSRSNGSSSARRLSESAR
jgi:hypothetical protein